MMKSLFFAGLLLFSVSLNAQKFEGLVKTPPMGWNTWNKFACNVDEKLIREMADASWGIDYLKYDFCNTDAQKAEGLLKIMRDD